ncbi:MULTISPECIES: pilus assembly FimT family protein [Psychrobacter]|uniref:pilus assembly FimT family protein n=1 Tax=Psychrobacter TaxID=497 RepID=UPI000EE696FF|nr:MULTISPECIES: prepilin-type N-terminal cleavage/methylation domain-containing protein [Psychrobacter]HCN17818.1 pilus assembly protein [Psychrobacter sp.]
MNAPANNLSSKLRMTESGFTLIELMVTIAVLAIIVGIAVPSISTQLAQNQIKATSTVIQTSIARAKAESAISRSDVIWTYNNNDKQIELKTRGDTIASYNLSDKSALSFNPSTETTLVINKEGLISTAAGSAANVIIDVSDSRAIEQIQRVRVNNKRAFECTGTSC